MADTFYRLKRLHIRFPGSIRFGTFLKPIGV